MPTKKKIQEAIPEDLPVEWFPAYGIRMPTMPHAIIYGMDEAQAMIRLAGFMADEGRRTNKVFTAKFKNDVFEVE